MQAPTQRDIQDMTSWMGILDETAAPRIHNPRVTAHLGEPVGLPQAVDEVSAMKNVLGSFYDAVGDMFNDAPTQPTQQPAQSFEQQTIWADDGMDYQAYMRQQQAPQTSHYQTYKQPAPSVQVTSMWEVVAEQYNGSKSLNTYSIIDSVTKKSVLGNILMKECAFAIKNLLNEGKTFDSPQLLGIISSGIRYTKEVKKVFENLKQRGVCLRESNYNGAATLDSKIQSNKTEAKNIRDELVSFLNTNTISYK